MANISIIKGDVTNPVGEGKKIIAHVCNDIGAYGAGVALAIRNKWPEAAKQYEQWCNKKFDYNQLPVLGQVQYVQVTNDIAILNMIAQRGIHGELIDGEHVPPIKYECLRECLLRVRKGLKARPDISLHMPMIGSKLAGGKWEFIYEIIRETFDPTDISITIYSFDDENFKIAKFTDEAFNIWQEYDMACERGEAPLFPNFPLDK